jgi:hypothetical protein
MTTDFRFVGWGLASHVTQHAKLWHSATKRRRRAAATFLFQFCTLDQGPPPVCSATEAADWLFGGSRSPGLRI